MRSISKGKCGPELWGACFLFPRLMSRRIVPTILGKEWGFPGIGPLPTLGPFMVSLGTVMALVGMSFSIC